MNNYAWTVQLVVTGLLAMVLAPPNASGGVGDYDYCTVSGPCGEGGGDCDANSECQAGLVCVQDQGAYYPAYPSPSANYDPSIVDVCEVPDPDLCADYGPCPAGNGDCDSDSECQAGLTCVADVGARYGYPANYDVCEAPTGRNRPDPDYCVTNYCGPGDGDCDPGQCTEGVCVNDVGAQYGFPAHYDVCEASSGDTGSGGGGGGDWIDVCDRTPQVRDALVGRTRQASCEDVTAGHLAGMEIFGLGRNSNLTTLKDGDFAGLTNLWILRLVENPLTTLPPGVFNGLTNLQELWLFHNPLTTLPPGVFNGLANLQHLSLSSNVLTTLPPGVFNGLSNLRSLNLRKNKLQTLSPGVFTGLSNLEVLMLENNQLTSLPPGVFADLPTDALILLQDNPGYPFPNDGRGGGGSGGGGGGTVDCNNAWTSPTGDFQVISNCLAACAAAQAGNIPERDANCSILRTYERHYPGTVLRYCPVCQ